MTDDFAKVDADEGYALVAYLDGHEYRTDAQDLGDWYDMDAVVGMLNSLCRARDKTGRFVTLPTGDQTAILLGAAAPAIEAASREGLIKVESNPSPAIESGKEFEDQVLRSLQHHGSR